MFHLISTCHYAQVEVEDRADEGLGGDVGGADRLAMEAQVWVAIGQTLESSDWAMATSGLRPSGRSGFDEVEDVGDGLCLLHDRRFQMGYALFESVD